MKVIPALTLLFALAGCVGDHHDSQANNFPALQRRDDRIDSARGGVPAVPPTAAVTRADLDAIRSETSASNNAAQQSLSGLGLQIGKLGERVEGLHSEISNEMRAEFQASVSAQASANLKANADLRAELSARVEAQTALSAKMVTDLRTEFQNEIKTELKAALQAQVAAQAGIGNRSDQTTAGRDAIQFTPEMARLLGYGVAGAVVTIVALCGVLCFALEMSRRRAEQRAGRTRSDETVVIRNR